MVDVKREEKDEDFIGFLSIIKNIPFILIHPLLKFLRFLSYDIELNFKALNIKSRVNGYMVASSVSKF